MRDPPPLVIKPFPVRTCIAVLAAFLLRTPPPGGTRAAQRFILPTAVQMIEYRQDATEAVLPQKPFTVRQNQMATNAVESVAEAAKKIYQDKLRELLEVTHLNQFVAIEPVSGEHFIGITLSAAIGASRERYPDRLPHALRIGHKAAVEFGRKIR